MQRDLDIDRHADDGKGLVHSAGSEYSFSIVSPTEDLRLAIKWGRIEREIDMEALDRDDVDYQREAWQHDCSF